MRITLACTSIWKEYILPAYRKQYDDLCDNLNTIEQKEIDIVLKAKQSKDLAYRTLAILQQQIARTNFNSPEEEVRFFKYTMPLFYIHFIYHYNIFKMEISRPIGSIQVQEDYLTQEANKIKIFFDENFIFIKYYRDCSTEKDIQYFTRGHLQDMEDIDPDLLHVDQQFSTAYDYLVAKIEANIMFSDYLNRSIHKLKHPELIFPEVVLPKLNWTSNTIDLSELIYALIADGCINNGKIPARTLASVFSQIFNVKLEFISKKQEEIRMRKKTELSFWIV